MLLWFALALVFRWRFQFSIRSLLVLAVVVAIPCSWMAVEGEEARKQREAVAAITKLTGDVIYDYQIDPSGDPFGPLGKPPAVPAWLRSLLGDDFFSAVVGVDLEGRQIRDADSTILKGLPDLEFLKLEESNVTDAELANLKGLLQVRSVNLSGTNVGDGGLEHSQGDY